MKPTRPLHNLGQRLWLDDLRHAADLMKPVFDASDPAVRGR